MGADSADTRMNPEFLKSLIQLLAQHGGVFTCPLSDLTPLGLELSLDGFGSSSPTVTLRLGARIYYVPAKEATAPCPVPPTPETSTVPVPTGRSKPSAISPEQELAAVGTLNNRAPQLSLAELQKLKETDDLKMATSRHAPAVKSDLDLYLLEQSAAVKRTAQSQRQATELRNATREYPWETRKPQ